MNATTATPEKNRTSDTFEDIILYAIGQEEAEHTFYLRLASQATSADLAQMLRNHAEQEKEHMVKLQQLLSRHRVPNASRIQSNPDLHISDYVVPSQVDPAELSYQDALILAIKKEQANENLYRDLSKVSTDEDSRALFTFLMEQERKHRDMLERDYDDNILQQN